MIAKALIVGGGIAGMSCAIQMRKAGLTVDLIDIDPLWRSYGAGITVTGPTLRALKTIGVLDEVLEAGATWNNAKLHDQSGKLLSIVDIPPLASDIPATGGVMRPALHKILSAQTVSLGTRVRLGVTLTELTERADFAEALFSDGSHGRYDIVVGADGIFSKLRDRLFATSPRPIATGQVVYRLVARRPVDLQCTHFFMGSDVKVGFNPVSATEMYMFLLHRAAPNPYIEPSLQPKALYDAMEGFGSFVPEIRETVLGFNSHSVNYRPLEVLLQPNPWYLGHVVLIGDAAHATTPHLASGAGMAVEDAIVLVEELSSEDDMTVALERFMARRFERCRLIIDNSLELGRLELSHGSPAAYNELMASSMHALRQPI